MIWRFPFCFIQNRYLKIDRIDLQIAWKLQSISIPSDKMAARIIATVVIKTIQRAEGPLILKYVKSTSDIERMELPDQTKESYSNAMYKADVPKEATVAVLRWVILAFESGPLLHLLTISSGERCIQANQTASRTWQSTTMTPMANSLIPDMSIPIRRGLSDQMVFWSSQEGSLERKTICSMVALSTTPSVQDVDVRQALALNMFVTIWGLLSDERTPDPNNGWIDGLVDSKAQDGHLKKGIISIIRSFYERPPWDPPERWDSSHNHLLLDHECLLDVIVLQSKWEWVMQFL